MDPALVSLLTQTITVEPFASRNTYGKPVYGASVSYQALWMKKLRQIRDNAGKIIVSRSTVVLDVNPTIGMEDRVTLPDGTTPPIVGIEQCVSDYGDPWVTRIYLE